MQPLYTEGNFQKTKLLLMMYRKVVWQVEEAVFEINEPEAKIMIEIVDQALIKLRAHPDNGEIYFNIITSSYINKEKLSAEETQRKYHLSPSTFYRYKKKAINLLAVILGDSERMMIGN